MQKLKLIDAIAQLRRELYEANKAAAKEELKLNIEAVEVEFAVQIEKHGEAGGEISFEVPLLEAKLKAGGELGNTYTHRIKLHLKPTLKGQAVDISGVITPKDD